MENEDIFIRDYFNEKLTDEQVVLFQKRYKEDADFKSLSDQMESEFLGIRSASRNQLKKSFTKWEEEANQKSQFNFTAIMSIAASIALLVGVSFYLLQSPAGEDLYISYYESYENFEHTVARDESSDVPSLKDQAYAAYDQKDYAKAAISFSTLLENDIKNIPVTFFRGMSRIELNQLDLAITDLEWVALTDDVYYSEAANWYMALIQMRKKNKKASKAILVAISKKNGTYQKKALELLEEY
jgi:hypothetical protein